MSEDLKFGILALSVFSGIMLVAFCGLYQKDKLEYTCKQSAIASGYTVKQITEICK